MGKKCQNRNGINIFEHWEVGFGKNMGWEKGLELPLQDPILSHPLVLLSHSGLKRHGMYFFSREILAYLLLIFMKYLFA